MDDYNILWYDYMGMTWYYMWTSSEQGKKKTQIMGTSSNMWPSLEDYTAKSSTLEDYGTESPCP